jgi:hypothetical protein
MNRLLAGMGILLMCSAGLAGFSAQEPAAAGPFKVQFGKGGITGLRYANDKYDTEYIAPGRVLGQVMIRYQMGENAWQQFSTADPKNRSRLSGGAPGDAVPQQTIIYNESGWDDYYADLEYTHKFRVEGSALYWTLHFKNVTHKPLVLGDVELPLPFNTEKRWDKTITTTERLEQHQFVSGNNSFVYWMRPNAEGPYLVMVPVMVCPLFEPNNIERNFAPAKLEFPGQGGVFIHSGFRGQEDTKRGGNWRQPQTSYTLSPKFTPNDELTYMFKFRWAHDYDGIRNLLVEEGLLDVNVVPGMTVPEGLDALIAIRSRSAIRAIVPEFPGQTQVEKQNGPQKDTQIFRVRFARLGENRLTVNFGKDLYTVLEFFVTQPLETLIKKRSAFIVSRQQHRDPAKWYNGLFSEWDMRNKILRSPDDTDGMHDYMVASDDPGLCKAPFVAGKNIDYPDPKEIEAVEYYLKNHVWGKLQMTEKEKYPYAIYGIDNWKINRDSKPADRNGWTEHVWRVFDYPHVVHLYWNMYRVAKFYPDLTHYLDKDGYLERAYGTAMAYYTVPNQVAGWSAEQLGNYDELVIADLLEELAAVGWKEKEGKLRRAWESKVEHFVNDRPNLFWSEFPFDPTGFESHHAFARYAVEAAKGESTLKVKAADAASFMTEEINGNILTRGWLENSFWQLGVEGGMRYTSQMGGWALLDYALHYSPVPEKHLRLGYASLLSSWALMNSGTAETNYGFWYPGPENDGAAGSAYVSQPYGRTWAGKDQARGPWSYSAEIDLGFGAALRAAATIVAEDPVFGLIAYGGRIRKDGGRIEVVPLDGLRRRLHVIRGNVRFHLEFDRDGLAAGQPVRFDEAWNEISFTLENRAPGGAAGHRTEMRIAGLPARAYEVTLDGNAVLKISGGPAATKVMLPVGKKESLVTIRRISP